MINLFRISIAMVIPISLLLLCGRWLDQRFRPELKYVLWLVLALRLMVPFSITLPSAASQVPVLQKAGTVERQLTERIQPDPQPAAQSTPAASVSQRPSDVQPAAAPESTAPRVSISQVLFWVWFAGFSLFLGYHLLANYHFRRKLRRWHQPLRDKRIRSLIYAVQEELGVRQKLQIIVWEGTASPLVTGVLCPILILPERNLDDVSFYYILRHEMTHIKRHDIAYQLILLLANSIHWFNPLVYMMRVQALHDMEVSCDARAIRGASRDDRVTYSEALLTAAIGGATGPAMLSTAFMDSKKSLKLRFREILASPARRRQGFLLLAAILAVAVLCGCTIAIQPSDNVEPAERLLASETPESTSPTPAEDSTHSVPEDGVSGRTTAAVSPSPNAAASGDTSDDEEDQAPQTPTASVLHMESAISVEGVHFGMNDTDVLALLGTPDNQEDYDSMGGPMRQLQYFSGVTYAFKMCGTCGAYHLSSISTGDATGAHMPLGIDTGDSVYEVLETLGNPEAEPTLAKNLYTIDSTHYATYESLYDNPQLEFIHIYVGAITWELSFGQQHQIYINTLSISGDLHTVHTQLGGSSGTLTPEEDVDTGTAPAAESSPEAAENSPAATVDTEAPVSTTPSAAPSPEADPLPEADPSPEIETGPVQGRGTQEGQHTTSDDGDVPEATTDSEPT